MLLRLPNRCQTHQKWKRRMSCGTRPHQHQHVYSWIQVKRPTFHFFPWPVDAKTMFSFSMCDGQQDFLLFSDKSCHCKCNIRRHSNGWCFSCSISSHWTVSKIKDWWIFYWNSFFNIWSYFIKSGAVANSKRWLTTSFLQPLPYLVTP